MSQQHPGLPTASKTRSILPHRSGRTLVVIGAVYLALLMLTGALLVLRAAVVGPDDPVKSYFRALAGRDGAAALRTLDTSSADTLLDPTLLTSPEFHPPTLTSIDDVEKTGNSATVSTTFTVDGRSYHHQFYLERPPARPDRFVRFWHLAGDPGQLTFAWPASSQVQVAGRTFDVDESFSSSAFVGGYVIGMPPSPLLAATPKVMVAGNDDGPAAAPSVTLKGSARTEIEAKLKDRLRTCAKSESLAPEGCPFGTEDPGDGVSGVSWKVDVQPEYSYTLDKDSVSIDTTKPGSATYSYEYEPYYSEASTQSGSVNIDVTAAAAAAGGKVAVTYPTE